MGLLARGATFLLILFIVASIYGDDIKGWWGDLKTNVYYKVNPAARRTLLINELASNLEEINDLISINTAENNANSPSEIRKAIAIVNNSKDLLFDIKKIEEESPGLLNKSAGLIASFISSRNKPVCEAPTATWVPPENK